MLSVLALLLATAAPQPGTLWAGHQAVHGKREVPLLGKVETRTDSYFLAEVSRDDEGRLVLLQRTCHVEIARAAGVKVSFLPGGTAKLPATKVVFEERGGSLEASFRSGWGAEDADGDGAPGVTTVVDAPLCSGKLYVKSESRTQLRGKLEGGGIAGEVRAVSDQETIEAEGACLSVMAKDERDAVRGTFAFAPVPAGTTCESLDPARWPVEAKERKPKEIERTRLRRGR